MRFRFGCLSHVALYIRNALKCKSNRLYAHIRLNLQVLSLCFLPGFSQWFFCVRLFCFVAFVFNVQRASQHFENVDRHGAKCSKIARLLRLSHVYLPVHLVHVGARSNEIAFFFYWILFNSDNERSYYSFCLFSLCIFLWKSVVFFFKHFMNTMAFLSSPTLWLSLKILYPEMLAESNKWTIKIEIIHNYSINLTKWMRIFAKSFGK